MKSENLSIQYLLSLPPPMAAALWAGSKQPGSKVTAHASTRAKIAAPRACPSFRAEEAFFARKTFSMTASTGECSMISRESP